MVVPLFLEISGKDECRAIFRNTPAVRLSGYQREIKARWRRIPAIFFLSLLCVSLVMANEWVGAFFWPIAFSHLCCDAHTRMRLRRGLGWQDLRLNTRTQSDSKFGPWKCAFLINSRLYSMEELADQCKVVVALFVTNSVYMRGLL